MNEKKSCHNCIEGWRTEDGSPNCVFASDYGDGCEDWESNFVCSIIPDAEADYELGRIPDVEAPYELYRKEKKPTTSTTDTNQERRE